MLAIPTMLAATKALAPVTSWASISDVITRRATFLLMFLVQAVLFWLLPDVRSTGLMIAVAFAILMCYGGGFGTMPASVADAFGPKNVGRSTV